MMANILNDYVNKRTAPYVIWTAVLLACALFFWLSRATQKQENDQHDNRRKGGAHRHRPIVSICLDGILLHISQQGTACSIIASSVATFLDLCAMAEVYTLACAADETRETEVQHALKSIGAFDAGLKPHRVMFSSTTAGRTSMVRQLQPSLHLESLETVGETLQGKVPEVRVIGSSAWPTLVDGVSVLNTNQ